MDENILIYDVKSGETLEKIGARIGMTGDQLKGFHNSHCGKMDKLWFDNLVGVRQIIIPKVYKTPEQLWVEKEKELPPSSVTRDFYADSYVVKESFSSNQESTFEIDYKININFKRKQETNISDEVIDVKCYDFKKNGTSPDDKMSAISLATMESTYPISFILPFKGKISGVFEFENLRKKFKEKRLELAEFFTGEVYQAYFDKFEAILTEQDS